ncbi:hypothetical protein [Falsiroseomonas sp. CW058]|uniref:hypothetical protein n=1 Tax=Falsiroseomonas sp. CW058 TaxID=3388664 RepID=UPI003D324306
MHAEPAALAELQRLVSRLEQSGLAARRADVAALLDRSKALLGPAEPAPRRQPPRRARARPAAKLRGLGLLGLDLLAAGAGLVMAAGLVAPPGHAVAVLAAALGWLLLRWGGAPRLLAEAAFRLRYAARWTWLWLAEAFSETAFERLQRLLDAREVMRGWRGWRAGLRRRARVADVEAFLEAGYGPQAAAAFRRALAAHGPGRAPLVEPPLRWSLLITLFEEIAAGDALWPAPASPPAAPPSDPAPAPQADPPERVRQRAGLQDAIRRKRAEIERTQEWKLKTPAEFEQRDRHVAQLRAELGVLEAELRALG